MLELIPFEKNSNTNQLRILANASRKDDEFLVSFQVEDKENLILWGESMESARVNDLWKTTCFEAFFGIHGGKEYWELNFAMNGRWNLYHFSSYRSNPAPEPEENVKQIRFESQQKQDSRRFDVRVPIQKLNLQSKRLEVGLASVIEFKNSEKSYFALKHIGSKPDFHQRDSFICNLE